jgi:hypothetical protein
LPARRVQTNWKIGGNIFVGESHVHNARLVVRGSGTSERIIRYSDLNLQVIRIPIIDVFWIILTRIILSAAGAGNAGGGIGYSTGFFNAKSSPLKYLLT